MINYVISILPTIQHVGYFSYWFVFLAAFLESFVIVGAVVPGATVVVLAGFLSSQGYLDIGDLIWFAAFGAILGDNVSYYLGTRGIKIFRHENKWLKEVLSKAKRFFEKQGSKSIFLGRFIGPIRSVVPFIAGLSGMRLRTFLFWNIVSGLLWASANVLLGYFFGDALGIIGKWSTRAGIFMVVVTISVILVRGIIKYLRSFFPLLKSIIYSIKDALLANTDVQKFVTKHPKLLTFIKRRLDRGTFSGLPLTLLCIAFIYILSLFLGTVQDVVTAESLVAIDTKVTNFLYAFRDAELIKVFLWITLLGESQILVSFASIASILLWIWKKKLYLVPLWVTLVGSYLFCAFSKMIIHRPRPEIAYYIEKGFSFPSGHATLAVAFYGFLIYVLFRQQKHWKIKVNILFAGLIIILGIGLSRLYLGVHYFSDVWGGYLLGALWLIIGVSITEWLKWYRPKEVMVPSQKIKVASVLLLLVGLIFYIHFALHYDPPRTIERETPGVIVASDIQDYDY